MAPRLEEDEMAHHPQHATPASGGTAPPPDDRSDDWREAQNTAGAHPGSAVAWVGLMVLLLGGLALMGAAFAHASGGMFAGGIALAGLAFVVPLELAGRRER